MTQGKRRHARAAQGVKKETSFGVWDTHSMSGQGVAWRPLLNMARVRFSPNFDVLNAYQNLKESVRKPENVAFFLTEKIGTHSLVPLTPTLPCHVPSLYPAPFLLLHSPVG